ncbi:MAG: MATE family efflux transporter, partial [Firmicutes bacterium]|nr:MATE family efflux transporter [Bacillota bacterium]
MAATADKYRNDLTEGSVAKKLFMFMVPFLLSMLLQATYSVADMVVVGIYMGDAGISAVNNSSIMTMFITGLAQGFALSGTVLVAQYVGAKDDRRAAQSMGTLFTIFIIIGGIITVLGLIFTPQLLNALNTPAEARYEAQRYLRICFAGTIFICGYNAVSSVLKGLGDSKRPLYFVLVATVLNIGLDVIFVGPMNMGAAGAALATIIAQGLSFVLAVITLKKGNFIFDFKLKSFRIDNDKAKRIFKIGLPSAVQSTAVNLSIIVVTATINDYGLLASTATGICAKIDSFAILPAVAIMQAVASMVGQNLGANEFERARKTTFIGMLYNFIFALIIFFLVRHFAEPLVLLFGCTEEAVEIAKQYISVVTYAYLFNAFTFTMNG